MSSPEILVASSEADNETVEPVVRILHDAGRSVLLYESDKVATGATEFSIRFTDAEPEIVYDGEVFRPEEIRAAWYRRPNEFELHDMHRQTLIGHFAQPQNFLWDLVQDEAWLNSPTAVRRVETNKIDQLVTAKRVGFDIPQTVVSNDWHEIDESLADQEVVFKTFNSMSYTKDGDLLLMYTRRYENTQSISHDRLPYPGIFQEFVDKTREWRVTVVGDETFDAAIYTEADAKDDWRRLQGDKAKVRFEKGRLPDDIREKCIEYLGHYGLRFGAFDFCEEPDGTIKFIEMNANGQYGWLEHELGLPISQAVAGELMRIADNPR